MSGTYVSVVPTPSSRNLIADRFRWINPSKASRPSSYHVTLIYSDGQEVIGADRLVRPHETHSAFLSRLDWFLGHDKAGYLVALVESQSLHHRHRYWKMVGGKHSFPDYKPHITLATGVSHGDWTAIKRSMHNVQLDLPILLTNERAEPIVKDWKATTTK